MPPRVIQLKNDPRKKKEIEKPQIKVADFLQGINFKGDGVIVKGDKGNDGYTPVKGKDYFTSEEIDAWLKSVTPKKGKHYFDGEKGEPGEKGDPGMDADEETIIARVLAEIPTPKDGKDGKDAKELDVKKIKKELVSLFGEILGSKKLSIQDIPELENRLNTLASKVERNYGGHGGTMKNITFTYSNGIATLNSPYPTLGDMEVYVGGARLFFETTPIPDFTSTIVGGNRVKQITLSQVNQDDIAQGSQLVIRGK